MRLSVQFPCSLPELRSLTCLKRGFFWQFCADVSNKSKSIKAIYIYASERSYYTLSEICVVHYALTYCFRDISA